MTNFDNYSENQLYYFFDNFRSRNLIHWMSTNFPLISDIYSQSSNVNYHPHTQFKSSHARGNILHINYSPIVFIDHTFINLTRFPSFKLIFLSCSLIILIAQICCLLYLYWRILFFCLVDLSSLCAVSSEFSEKILTLIFAFKYFNYFKNSHNIHFFIENDFFSFWN